MYDSHPLILFVAFWCFLSFSGDISFFSISIVTVVTTVTTIPPLALINLRDFSIYAGNLLNTQDSQCLIFPVTDNVLLTP